MAEGGIRKFEQRAISNLLPIYLHFGIEFEMSAATATPASLHDRKIRNIEIDASNRIANAAFI